MALLLWLSLVIAITSEQILCKSLVTGLFEYRWALLEIMIFVQTLWLLFLAYRRRHHLSELLEDTVIPYCSIAGLAMLDFVQSVCLIISMAVLPGTMTVVLPQLMIPIASAFNYFCLQDAQISRGRYAFGCVLIVVGVGVEIFVQVIHSLEAAVFSYLKLILASS